MKIEVHSDFPGENNESHNFPLGSVDRNYIHIGSIALDRKGDGGQINEAQARVLLAEAILRGAEINIKFENVEITLNGL